VQIHEYIHQQGAEDVEARQQLQDLIAQDRLSTQSLITEIEVLKSCCSHSSRGSCGAVFLGVYLVLLLCVVLQSL